MSESQIALVFFACILLTVPAITALLYVWSIDQQLIAIFTGLKVEKQREISARNNRNPGQSLLNFHAIRLFAAMLVGIFLSAPYLILDHLVFNPIRALATKIAGVKYMAINRLDWPILAYPRLTAYDKVIAQYEEPLMEATRIRMSIGEMGYRLMGNPKLLRALEKALNKGAEVTIVHGPRVDPKTTEIYELARRFPNLVILKSDTYHHNHFFLVETGDRNVVIDEGIHDEMLWDSRNGEPIYEHRTRLVYVYDNKPNMWNSLNETFENRAGASNVRQEISNPGLEVPQEVSFRRMVREYFKYYALYGDILQVISIAFDKPQTFLFN